jgi:hypothetical protein
MDEEHGLTPRNKLVYLGKPHNQKACLLRKADGLRKPPDHEPLDLVRQVLRYNHRAPQAAGENPPAHRCGHPIPPRLDPDAAPRQAARQIGDDGAVGAQDEADEVVSGPLAAADSAQPQRSAVAPFM